MTRTLAPRAAGGRFLANLARTTPELPWARVICALEGGIRGQGVWSEADARGWVVGGGPATHPAPDAAELGALLKGLGLVDKGNPLAGVEVDLLAAVHTVQLEQGGVVVLVDLLACIGGGGRVRCGAASNGQPAWSEPPSV